MGLSAARDTDQMDVEPIARVLNLPVKGTTIIYQGGLVALDAGFLVPMSTMLGLLAVGRAERTVDNSTGGDGDMSCPVKPGVFKWANGAALDAIAQLNIPCICFASDDQTVNATDAIGTRSAAGVAVGVEADGVWVQSLPGALLGTLGPGTVINANLANGAVTLAKIAGADKVPTTNVGAADAGKLFTLDAAGKAAGVVLENIKAAALVDTAAVTTGGAGNTGKALVLDAAGKAEGRELGVDGAKLDSIQSGVTTLFGGVSPAPIAAHITANSRIICSVKSPVPGAGSLTIQYAALVGDRVIGAPGSLAITALLADGTINVLDTSDVDYLIIG